MSQIKCVLFDLGGVVLNWNNSWLIDEISKQFNLSKKKFEQEFDNHLGILSSGKMTEKEFWQSISKKLDASNLIRQDSILEPVFRKLVSINQSVYSLSSKIKENGLSIGILSNTEPVTYSVIESLESFAHFDYKFLSYEIGLVKPDPKIYEHVVNNLPYKKEELFFIDDTIQNVDSANDFGLRTIQFHSYDSLVNDLEELDIL
ncbi:hypothetical protein C6988_06470 [Nitrosopumilus sp. b1]|uniref:HAD family hydrolase n=1 Tax=Nitrosopumilus sp. b1 TaxID=2109907 RepID=UPI0015F5F390|nr:HAD family phosphatase [Nitrosopumilus sp. b1]KAF6242822.1 hypothetical protein C6988_06470 [Nitrosopumilus sp. b1]